MLNYLVIAISSVLVSNIILTQFLGICPFLGVSKNKKNAIGMGISVTLVTTLATIITWLLNRFVLSVLEIEFMQTVIYILVIATLVQCLEMFIKKYFNSLYKGFGVYLPLITTNCVVLGVCLNSINFNYNIVEALVYALFTGVGYTLVIYIFSAIRVQLDNVSVPKAFKGVSIGLIVAACLAMAFSGFVGII